MFFTRSVTEPAPQNSITSYGPREAPEGKASVRQGLLPLPGPWRRTGVLGARTGMSWRAGAMRPLIKATELAEIREESGRGHSWERQGRWAEGGGLGPE